MHNSQDNEKEICSERVNKHAVRASLMLFIGTIKFMKTKKGVFSLLWSKSEHLPYAINSNTTSPWVIIKLKYFHLLINRKETTYSNKFPTKKKKKDKLLPIPLRLHVRFNNILMKVLVLWYLYYIRDPPPNRIKCFTDEKENWFSFQILHSFSFSPVGHQVQFRVLQ